jgi:tRNA 2-thiouridine synthesizing protein A
MIKVKALKIVKPMDEPPSIAPDEIRLDLRGLKCPLPALKTRVALARLSLHAILVVEATDPMAAIDIPHLLATTGDTLVEQNVGGPVLIFRIRKVAGPRGRSPLSRADRRDGET